MTDGAQGESIKRHKVLTVTESNCTSEFLMTLENLLDDGYCLEDWVPVSKTATLIILYKYE